ncbi:unnamed protein product [Rotaria sordida]|uniref:U-box domain-containing protein n=1 Tax=Rotaria sordida TaxID=392033 RepID=A0A814IFD4_9BILA|nr:unnamed protein product [Rotaria sordida]
MTEENSKTDIENPDLICPITFELFRDPVIAKDGHVYEREAITRWILQHGTSPLTRQPLQINDLQPDDRLRHLAHQGRNSTVSYNAHDASIILPPLRRLSININVRVAPEQTSNLTRITRQVNQCPIKKILIIICLIIIPPFIIFGIALGITNFVSRGIYKRQKH